jgi:hypothetical protein
MQVAICWVLVWWFGFAALVFQGGIASGVRFRWWFNVTYFAFQFAILTRFWEFTHLPKVA